MNAPTKTTESMALAATHAYAPPALAAGTASAAALMLDERSLDKIMRVADMMASGRCTIPQHLQKSQGDCFAVAMQAIQWNMNPFAVAQKTHISQSGALSYEAQLISAVVTGSGAVDGDPEYEFLGDWNKVLGKVEERKSEKGGKYYVATYTKADEAGLGVICRLRLRGESAQRELPVMMSQCYPRFSTQWATDPKQQICYVAIRKWARLHKPGLILGVYTPDELDQPHVREMGDVVLARVDTDPASAWPADLLTQARDAATNGAIAYSRFWKTLDKATAAKLAATTEHADNKERALKADAGRTVDTPAATAAPAVDAATGEIMKSFDEVMAMLCNAANEDALNVAMDWANAIQDTEQHDLLAAKYDERLGAMRGAA